METESAAVRNPPYRRTAMRVAAMLSLAAIAVGCGGSASSAGSSSSTSSSTSTNQYVIAYKAAAWSSTTTSLSYPSSCEMTITTTGKPNYTPNPYYLGPAMNGSTVVAYTSVTNTALSVISYANIASSLEGSTATIDICPAKAASTTATGLGAIGYLISGTAMFNSFEMNASTPAVSDNASYTFTDSSGTVQTAYFLDQCNTHSNGTTWHAHGNPACVTSQVDTATGPSHIIGVALDGFPIYGGRDINGNVITASQLDACNGITSATPEFPDGAYHYVLPLNVTSKYASINCFSGTVSSGTAAAARKLACNMKTMMAMIEKKQGMQLKKEDQQAMSDMATPDRKRMAGSM